MKDMAHELSGDRRGNEIWEVPGDMAHELTGHGNANEVEAETEELSGDMANELRGGDIDMTKVRDKSIG